MTPEKPLLVIAGPTASGKSFLALSLAEQLQGEVVSCDSVSVYRMMDIGSAKPTAEERRRIPHHCIDLFWPNEACTAGDYARHARSAIADISRRGKLPIVAGGTGLYLRALLQGLAPAPPRDESLRQKLRARAAAKTPGYLHRLLQRLDSKAAAKIHLNDTPKLIRSIEVSLTVRKPQTEQWKAGRDPLTGYSVLQLCLSPPREALYDRINQRAAGMFDHGLVAETAILCDRFGEDCHALTSLGYAQAHAVLRRHLTLPEAIIVAQQGHRNYAKRQLTWFRRETQMQWLKGFGSDAAVQRETVERVEAFFFAQKNQSLAFQ